MTDAAPTIDVTTVSDTTVVVHVTRPGTFDVEVHRFDELPPDSDVHLEVPDPLDPTTMHSVTTRTLGQPSGPRRSVFATVNDVHFGELAAGQIDDFTIGPIRRPEPGDEPYPEVMNRAAVEEIAALDPTPWWSRVTCRSTAPPRNGRRSSGAIATRSATASTSCAATTTAIASRPSTPATNASTSRG